MSVVTEDCHDDVLSSHFDGTSGNEVDGIEDVSGVDEGVTGGHVGRLELQRKGTKTA